MYPPAAATPSVTIAAMNQMILRFLPEKKFLDLGVKEGKPFHQWLCLHPKVYEMAVKIRSGNYEEIVGVGVG